MPPYQIIFLPLCHHLRGFNTIADIVDSSLHSTLKHISLSEYNFNLKGKYDCNYFKVKFNF